MVDRQARDVLAECIRLFLEGEVDVDELEELAMTYIKSPDLTLSRFAILMNYIEWEPDDLSKQQWDSIQRYLLLLDSDRQLVQSSKSIWTGWQLIALVGVFAFVLAGLWVGFWWALGWLSLPSGMLSWHISKKKHNLLTPIPWLEILTPFESFSSIKATLDEVNRTQRFVKMRHPRRNKKTAKRKIRHLVGTELIIFYLVFPSFFILPFQALPVREVHWKVVPTS